MDIFRFQNPTDPAKMEDGKILNGFKSKMWVERYRQAGEFTLVASVDTGLRNQLPIGSFISHTGTSEIMIVENHEISDERGRETEVVITGRGFESFFENRVVGSNKAFPTSGGIPDYVLAADYTWNQAVELLSDHILASRLLDDGDSVPFVELLADVDAVSSSLARIVRRGDLYSALISLLEVDNLGIKVVRPGIWSPIGPASPNIAILIHKGVDRRAQVIFSYDTGEIERADYLWSNKKLKNTAMVSGRWVETLVETPTENHQRRMMLVDASDIDGAYSEPPAGVDLENVLSAMQQRGIEALAAQNSIALTKAEVSKDSTKAVYRKDFDLGDQITVSGDFNEQSGMRVSEYVEIEDENGDSGYPTLTVDQ